MQIRQLLEELPDLSLLCLLMEIWSDMKINPLPYEGAF